MNKLFAYVKKEWKFFLFLLGAILLFVVDLVSKWIVERNCVAGTLYPIIPNFLYVSKSYNTAIAFSLGESLGVAGRVINIIISVVMSVLIAFFWAKKKDKFHNFEHTIAMLLLSGAVGNLIDRAFYWEGTVGFNGVIDFISFYLGGGPTAPRNFLNPFATFNFADSFLVIGVLLFIVYVIIDQVKASKNKKPEEDLTKDPRDIDKEKESQE